MRCYSISKQTGTHADALAAIGAADLLQCLAPRLVELQDRFEIRFPRPLALSDLVGVEPGFSYFERPGKTKPDLRAARMECRGSTKTIEEAEGSFAAQARLYSILGRMKAYAGPNKVIARFARSSPEAWTRSVWDGLHGRPCFGFSSALVQLFNPHSGKGYALLKPTGTSRADKTKDRWAEPFVEWLRFRGYFAAGAGWFTAGDLRLYCPIPTDISYSRFSMTAAAFRALRLGGSAVKMDCRAILALTRLCVESAQSYRRPCEEIRGVSVTHYKDMGQAHTVMAMEQLALPDWLDLRNFEHSQLWVRVLDEHETAVRRLTDSHSDEFALLQQYRQTFQMRRQESILQLLNFLEAYGQHLFRRRAQGQWLLPQFTMGSVVPVLSRVPALKAMLDNPGFLAIAAAIRGSTVGAQAARYRGSVDHREIRYGLLADMRRAAFRGPQALREQVAGFVSAFNQEGTRRRSSGLRSIPIQPWELAAFVSLLEQLPAKAPVGSVLSSISGCLPGTVGQGETEHALVQAVPA